MFTISFLKPEDLKGMCSLHSFDDPSWLERGSRGKGIFADNSVRLSEEEEGSSVGKCLASQLARGKALTDDQPGRFCVRLPNFKQVIEIIDSTTYLIFNKNFDVSYFGFPISTMWQWIWWWWYFYHMSIPIVNKVEMWSLYDI